MALSRASAHPIFSRNEALRRRKGLGFMRFFARFISFVMLVAAVVVAAVDAIRFVATSLLELLPFRAVLVWLDISPEALSSLAGGAGMGLLEALIAQPAAPVFLVLSLLFWMAGYRRPKPFRPFATTGA